MSAAATDKLRKLSRRWVSQIGSGGVADAEATTIPLSSTTNLATDTAVTLVIDRVDANGTATPTLEETIVGVVSSTNIINAVRGVEGTAQAHSAGAVVEVLVTADGYNDIVDWGLVAHNQDGTHKSGSVLTLPQINDTTADHQYVMSVCELTADRTVALPLLTGNDEFTFNAHAQTLSNKTLTLPQINDTTADHQYVMSVCELTADRTVALPLLTGNDEFVFKDHTQTLTNKRIEPRIVTAASYTTDTGTSLSVATADVFQVTAQAGALKLNNPGGTPVAGQKLIIRIKDNGTGRALTYDTQYRASTDLAYPTTTTANKTIYMGLIFNATDTKWDLVALLDNI